MLKREPFSRSHVTRERKGMGRLSRECRQKAERDGYSSCMNNTKWREVCFTFARFDGRLPAWRTRDLLNGHLSEWDTEWFHHVGPDYCSIEWLELDPRAASRDSIRELLQEVNVPFEEGEYLKVFGYMK